MSTMQITRRQHYVAETYQNGWSDERWAIERTDEGNLIWVHDLVAKKAINTGASAMLATNWFYEKNQAIPDNEHERWFWDYEGPYANTMRHIDGFLARFEEIFAGPELGLVWEKVLAKIMEDKPDFPAVLKKFAAVCYARTPEAMKLKKDELLADPQMDDHRARISTDPYEFVKNFRESTLLERFLSLNLQFWIAPDGGLLTSDRPCYDFRDPDSGTWPLSGYDIGRLDDVAVFMPLTPQLGILLVPSTMTSFGKQHEFPAISTKVISSDFVNTVNTMTINLAGRWVVGNRRFDSIFNERKMPVRGQSSPA